MGTTVFFCLATPKSGGDTLYLSTTAAYENLSEDYRKRLHGLYATHSGFDQAHVSDHKERYVSTGKKVNILLFPFCYTAFYRI